MTRLFKYQKKGVRQMWAFLRKYRVTLNADDMGLGKTIQALMIRKRYLRRAKPVIVVCPATARDVWMGQAAEHVGVKAIVLLGRKPTKEQIRQMKPDRRTLYIIGYDVLQYWLPALVTLRPLLVVADECQRLKNKKTKWTKAFCKLAEASKYKIFLGGTGGVEKTPNDIWPILSIAEHPSWPKRWKRYASSNTLFIKRFCKVKMWRGIMIFEGGKNLKQLNRFLKSRFMVRRRTKDVLKDLPPLQRHVVQIPAQRMKEYFKAEASTQDWFERVAPRLRGGHRNVQERTKFMDLLSLLADLKMEAIKEWIDDFMTETGEKLLVFGWNKKVVQGLHKHYAKDSTRVDGSVTGPKRRHATDRFNNDHRCRKLFGNIKAAGEAWSCKGTSTVLFVQMYPNPAVHNQAEKRAHGVGRGVKGKPTRVFYLVAKNTIEERMVKKLHKEQAVIDGIIDGGKKGGFDQTSMIRSVMLQRTKPARRKR